MVARPIDDKDRAAVKRLHAKGKSRNDIARAIKRSPSTVSKIANGFDPPLTFDRAPVEAATAARKADLAARRATLALDFHTDAERLRAQMWEPCKYGEFGGKDNKWSEVALDRPRFGDQRQIIAAAQTAMNASLRLAPIEGGADAGQVRSMLGALGEALAQAADDDQAHDDGGDTGG
ncbi:helix-turn-helix DNA binding domain protein [Streptomyces phage HFrancette]|uniref:Helix-turn-helix DNA binding domain protein n=2 Tax=Ignaciovirus TaxID=3152509 RepID=A0A9E7NGZ2_9CAUD|nr:helix-turn-helix DNA-binding domain protein [Streptomyces phage Ignacio]YP_010756352.1 helix-turn-helix DNA binding domain protein [Streptomyces phage HFrancette]QKN87528.1 helix-turn-helix DNA-binding domain protein [Streptomyces phage Ignacio]UTN92096.1 helix-turn-helix DNA binding domain protein [Streptomyces phage HFrancette]